MPDLLGPLDGLRVVDLTQVLSGPFCTMLLADLGADVIKVEPPGGDVARRWGPHVGGADAPASGSYGGYFASVNRNKRSVCLDLKDPDGRSSLLELLEDADVLVENFRPGVLDRLGFSVEHLHALNPRLVILSISGFGHDGPEGARAGYDQIAQGEAGLMSLTGPSPDQPTRVGVPIGDLLAGMYGAYGVVAALHERARTNRGRVVRTSLLAAIVGVHAFQGTRYTVAGEIPRATGGHHPSICPYGLFHAADGPVQIAVGSDGLWRRFAPAFGLDRPQWATNPARVADHDAVIAAIDAAFSAYPAAELLSRLDELGVPAGKVRDLAEVYAWEQTRSQGLLVSVEHAALGLIDLPGPPLRFDGIDDREHAAPPTLDQHGAAIRAWLAQAPSAEPGSAAEVAR